MGQIFSAGWGRTLLLITPAAAVSFLPVEWIEGVGLDKFVYVCVGLAVALAVALWTYHAGVRRYQSVSYVSPQG